VVFIFLMIVELSISPTEISCHPHESIARDASIYDGPQSLTEVPGIRPILPPRTLPRKLHRHWGERILPLVQHRI
jgi:hypothetical protein